MATLAEMQADLTTVQASISTILAGAQSGAHGDRQWRFAELEALQARERQLQWQIERAQRPMRARTWP